MISSMAVFAAMFGRSHDVWRRTVAWSALSPPRQPFLVQSGRRPRPGCSKQALCSCVSISQAAPLWMVWWCVLDGVIIVVYVKQQGVFSPHTHRGQGWRKRSMCRALSAESGPSSMGQRPPAWVRLYVGGLDWDDESLCAVQG